MITNWKSTSYEDRLKECKMMTIRDRRRRADLLQMWKTMHGADGSDLTHCFDLAQRHEGTISTRESLGYLNVKHKKPNKEVRSHFWSVRVCSPWNSLPDWMKKIDKYSAFQKALDELIFSDDWKNMP